MKHFHVTILYLLCVFIIPLCRAVPTNTVDKEDVDFVQRQEKCEAIPYKQEIVVPGCETEIIDNHYCKGQCMSGYVPENGVNGKYECSSCQPYTTVRKPIMLKCSNGKKKIVDVEIFMGCKCMTTKCHVSDYNFENFGLKTLGLNKPSPALTTEQSNRPCRSVCRKCRKAKREYHALREKKDQMEYLQKSCLVDECKKRISTDIFGRTRMQKKLKKAVCKECQLCKKRKRQKINA